MLKLETIYMKIIKFPNSTRVNMDDLFEDISNAIDRFQNPKGAEITYLPTNNVKLTREAMVDDINNVANPDYNKNVPNRLDLYSQLSNWHESDNITMIIGGNTYTASKQQMMSVLSYYVGMMNMRNMCNLNMNLNFGEMQNTPNSHNTPNRSNRNIKK